MKTLHPAVHGGILAIRDNQAHMDAIAGHHIQPIDLVREKCGKEVWGSRCAGRMSMCVIGEGGACWGALAPHSTW